MTCVRSCLAALLSALLLLPTLAMAQDEWPRDVRRKYVDECLSACTVNTSFTSIQRAECPPFCECKIKEAQTFMSADDARAFLEAMAAKKPSPLQAKYDALNPVCAKRVFK